MSVAFSRCRVVNIARRHRNDVIGRVVVTVPGMAKVKEVTVYANSRKKK